MPCMQICIQFGVVIDRQLAQTEYLLDLLDLPVLLSHCIAFMTDLNVGQIISNTNSLVLVQF